MDCRPDDLSEEVRPAPLMQQENIELSHCSTSPHGNHISTERDAKFIRSKGQQGTIYSVKRVLLIQVIKASWVSGTTYAFPSKVTNYSAIRDHGTELPPCTDAINKFELVVKYL